MSLTDVAGAFQGRGLHFVGPLSVVNLRLCCRVQTLTVGRWGQAGRTVVDGVLDLDEAGMHKG